MTVRTHPAAVVPAGAAGSDVDVSLIRKLKRRVPQWARYAYSEWRDRRRHATRLSLVRPYTMLSERRLVSLAGQVEAVLRERIPGALVECGVWRGGASFLMADVLRRAGATDRRVWLFDSFEGLPPADPIDGARAQNYRSEPDNFENCSASYEEVEETARRLGLAQQTQLVKGWFQDTLPVQREKIGRIALLRVDGDWHASVLTCLENLYDQVSDGGFIVLDDYHDWQGCAVAVHEFLGRRSLSHRIITLPGGPGGNGWAMFRKA